MGKNEPLSNINHEKFALFLTEGKTPVEAYRCVYGNRLNAQQNATKLLKTPRVQARFVKLRNSLLEKTEEKALELGVNKAISDLRNREVRIQKLSEVAQKLENVMKDRAALYAKLPGADFKLPGHREGIVVPVFQQGKMTSMVDTAVIKEYRATLQQINEECGPDRIEWGKDDGLIELAKALESSPTEPPTEPPSQSIATESPLVPTVPTVPTVPDSLH